MKLKLIVFAALVASSVQAQTNRIEGQIFIATKGGSTVKLSAVTVRVVSLDKLKAVKAAWLRDSVSIIKAQENDADWRKRIANLVEAMPRMSASDRAVAKKTYDTLFSQLSTNQLIAKRELISEYEFYSQADWQAVRTTESDADGNFSVEIPAGSWSVLVLAKRNVGDTVEKYVWCVPAPESGRLFLNNKNLSPD